MAFFYVYAYFLTVGVKIIAYIINHLQKYFIPFVGRIIFYYTIVPIKSIKTNQMNTSKFEKHEFTENFDHSTPVIVMMNKMGYSNVSVETCLTNGLSHYIRLNVEVLNEGKCWADMFVYNGKTDITIRISNHDSGLERNCGGVCGNKMTMAAFKQLIATGAIKNNN